MLVNSGILEINRLGGRKMNEIKSILADFLKWTIDNDRISGNWDGGAGQTLVHDSFELMALDFIKHTKEAEMDQLTLDKVKDIISVWHDTVAHDRCCSDEERAMFNKKLELVLSSIDTLIKMG